MSTTSVYNALNSYIDDNSIDLWEAANGSADLSGMLPVLALFNIDSSYVLTSVVLTQSPSGASVQLTGQGSFAGGATYPVSATLQYVQDGDVFSLALAVSTDWIFSDFFPSLPETLMQNPAVQLGITWYDSVLIGMAVRSAVFTGVSGTDALTLTGFLLQPDNAYLLSKTPMIGPWPLRLSGSVSLPTSARTYPLIDVDARGNDTIISGAQEPGVAGPDAISLSNPGLTLLVQPLVPPMAGNDAFSTIELFGDFALGSITGRISTLILSTGDVWNFVVQFDKETASLVQGLAQLTAIFGVELPIPMNFPVLSDFYVAEVDIDLQNNGTDLLPVFSLLNLAITIRSDKTWQPPIPFVTFSKVGTRWVWGWTYVYDDTGAQIKTYTLTGSVFGQINFGGGTSYTRLPDPSDPDGPPTVLVANDKPVSIAVKLSLPDFIISGTLADDTYISIGDALDYFFGNSGPSTGTQQMNVTKLRFTADPIGQNYFAQAAIFFGDPTNPDPQQGWEINLYVITIVLNELEFYINVNNGNVSGGISGTFFLQQGSASDYTLPRILLSAEYPPQNPDAPEGWTLSGYLYPGTSINLTQLVYQFIYGESQQPPDWIPTVTIDRLAAQFTTGSQNVKSSYLFGGTASARWAPSIFGTTLSVSASASVDVQKPSTTDTPSGKISGMFSVNKISLTASLTFGVPEPTYLFKVQFDEIWLQATTSWRGEQSNRHQVVSLQLGGVTLGDMLEYLVNLAAPTIGFQLDSPWDVLKQVDLSRFVLTIDPQDNIVEFVFNANVDLVIAQINSIGVRYSKNGGESQVDLILTGSFLGQEYTDDKPLSWDVVNDPPPAVPGQGTSLVNLRYLGLGQRVTFKGETPNTVAESIAKLSNDMPEPPPEGDPMPVTMEYSADSQWLIGLDIQLMETLDLGFIFNDPKLYGLSIALGGERAGSLAGLRFEILYKKITDEIGMFRIEFQVPDMFRTIQFGVVSITLGIIVIEIYTNGNFKIDLGFPYNQDFSRSFSLQATIFIGRGGFYLGVLNGDTSTQVPKISNGNFSPVIELGIGISAGVGREIRAGILAGGAYVELQVIFQGVLAWFNPNSSGTASATYFKCQGVAALHGKVYGSVDFAVVKVSVTLEAYAQVSIIYECYQPMQITLSVNVRAEASIKILFIKIHFSFSVELEISFTLGSAQPTPWILSSNGSSGGSSSALLRRSSSVARSSSGYTLRRNQHRRLLAMRHTSRAARTAMLRTADSEGLAYDDAYILNWQPSVKVFTDSPRNAHLTLLPQFTIAGVPVNWDGTVPANSDPNYRTAFVLFADTGMDVNAATAKQCAARSSAHSAMTATDDDTSLLAADILTQGLTLYAIGALPRDPAQGNYITAADLALLLEQLDLPEAMSDGLSITNLVTFFTTNINLWISGDTDPRPDEKSAMVLPMPPFLNWTSSQGGNVDFSTENEVGPWYEWGISQVLNAYFPVSGETGSRPTTDNPSDYESFTSFMFRDFCMMVIQSAVKEMQKHLNDTTVTVTLESGVVQNLSQVAASLPSTEVNYTIQSGDTIDSVAQNLGATPEELEFLNPDLITQLQTQPVGTVLSVTLGISPEVLALDNPDKVFAVTQCQLGTLVHQAADGETLQDIATLFQVASVTALLSYQDEAYPSLAAGSNILLPGATFDLAQQTFSNAPADFVQLRTAGVFFVRYSDLAAMNDTPVPDMANWYVQAIASLNQALLATLFPDQKIPSVVELPPGQTLVVPSSYGSAYTESAYQNNYTTVAGDTLNRIGYALTFQQDYPTSNPAGVTQWQTFQAGVTSAGTQSWNIPAQNGIAVEAGETIESLVRRLIVDASWTGDDPSVPTSGTWTYNWTNVAVWIGGANVLAPLASVTVPNAETAVSSSLSFTVLAKTYGLTITDAAARLQSVSGLYAEGTVLLVKLLPTQDIDVLVSSVLQGDSFASIVNQASRMLMSGLQLPGLETEDGHVVPDTSNPLPLYDLTGQQFSLTVDSTQPDETALALSLYSQQPWIQLFNSITVQTGQTLAQLEEQYPDLLTYNPGLSESTFKVGMVLLTATVSPLTYSYTNGDIIADSPASGLAVQPVPASPPAPSVMPVSGTVPRTYGLDNRIELQAPVTLPIPQVQGQQIVTGNPGMWRLPDALLVKAEAGVTTLYEILAAPEGGKAGATATQIDNSTFGTVIPFKIKRLNESSSEFSLIGVDTDQRSLLISLSNWLNTQGSGSTQAFQLLSPSPDAVNTSGLTVLSANAGDAYLIKTNLSTLSVPPSLALARTESGDGDTDVFYASLASLADFLTLLWEGSVVGGTGYYFSPGQELPGSAFDQQGNITLQLLVIVGTQQSVAPDGRSLLPFNNCALIGPGNDSMQLSLYIQSAGSDDPSETVVQALLPPGNVGFNLLMANPETQSGSYTAAEILLKTFYGLLCFEVAQAAGSPFCAPDSGMPVLPDPSDGTTQQPWEKERALRKAIAAGALQDNNDVLPYWKYSQVLPVSRFILPDTELAAADVPGLPPQDGDPYQGYGTQSALPSASFVFSFGDVLGNRSGANGAGEGATSIPVGYTDRLVGIGDWPSVARYFNVLPSNSGALLSVVIAPRPSELLPTPSQPGDVNADQLIQLQQQYSQVYYQLIQPGIEGWIVSSLNYIADANYGNKGTQISDISPLWKFAAGSYAVISGVMELSPAVPAGATTIGDILTQYGVRYTELAQANANLLVADLFGSTLPDVPAYYPFVQHQSISGLYAMPPAGWPKPASAEALLELTQNTTLPLTTGIGLIIPTKTISTGATQPTQSLQQLADANNTGTDYLAAQNAGQAILEIGFEFTAPIDDTTDLTIAVTSATNSLDLMASAFAAQGVNITAESLADLNKDGTGMFAVNQSLSVNVYIVKEGDTLAANSSGQSVSTLAAANVDTPDIFDPGALVYFGNFSGVTSGSTPPTLQEFADRYACPADLLLSSNSGFTLPQSSAFLVPGTLSWPLPAGSSAVYVPYTIRDGETLNGIAGRFNFDTSSSAGLQLATLNENMPGTIEPNITLSISVGGTIYDVDTGDDNPSFASVLASLQTQAPSATLNDIVTSIGDTAGDLDTGGLLLCPPAKFQQVTQPDAIAPAYGISAGAFALANAAMLNIIAANVTVYNPEKTVSITTIGNDTFNSLIARFADQGVTLSASEIIEANMTAPLIRSGALAFLPPAQISFTANIGQGGPYLSPIVPLQTSVRLLRPAALIDTAFKTVTGTGPVEMAESDFPAPVNNTSADSGLNLNIFVDEMKAALPNLRLGTGKVKDVVQDLWQVDFDSNGIKQVSLSGGITVNSEPQPRFFALTPLYQYLVTRTISVASLNPDGTLTAATEEISFQSIDVELWARTFLEQMDQFLSGSYAVAVYGDTSIRTQLASVITSKQTLIPAIAGGLNMVLDVSDPDKDAALSSATKAFEQQLGVSLSKTYEATVLIQYDSSVESAWQTSSLEPASLYGEGTITNNGVRVEGLTMVAAKTDLSLASGYVNFLMTLDNPALHKDISGSFGYNISHLEFNIASVDMPGDYKSSDWLSFIPLLAGDEKPSALSGTDPGEVDVPIPLRNFPDMPKIVGQLADQSYPDGTQDVSDLAVWDYQFTYSHQHSAQDYVLITIDFNLTTPDQLARAEDEPRDLFTELAQYITVSTQLWNLLNGLTDPKTTVPKSTIENAVQTYATLAANVAQYWGTRLPQSSFNNDEPENMVAGFSYSYNARVTYRDLSGDIDSLTLSQVSGSGSWPDVFIQLSSGLFLQLEAQTPSQNSLEYLVPSGVSVQPGAWPVFRLVWGGLNLAIVQNARAQMSVQRNQNLIDGVETDPDFIFSTDTIIAPAIVTPLNTYGKAVDITSLGSNLTDALNACFTDLFGSDAYGQVVTMELSYGFELVAPSTGNQGLVTYLPIGLYPNQILSAGTAAALNTAVETWQTTYQPVETGGEWVFSLKQYSQLTDESQTLLNIERLVYRLSSS